MDTSPKEERMKTFLALFVCLLASFLGPHSQHMEVSRLGVKQGATAASLCHSHSNIRSEPRCNLHYTTGHGNAGSLTHWARPGMKSTASSFLVGFVSAVPQQELQKHSLKTTTHKQTERTLSFQYVLCGILVLSDFNRHCIKKNLKTQANKTSPNIK